MRSQIYIHFQYGVFSSMAIGGKENVRVCNDGDGEGLEGGGDVIPQEDVSFILPHAIARCGLFLCSLLYYMQRERKDNDAKRVIRIFNNAKKKKY